MVESTSTSEEDQLLLSSKLWKLKLDKKLRGLADSASKDTILTVSIYIGFNRKYSNVIAKSLFDVLTTTSVNEQRQWLFWQIIHELLLANHTNPTKYDKYLDLRTTLCDVTIIPAIKSLGNNVLNKDKLEPLLKEWDEHNVFSSPKLVTQIRRMLVSSSTTTATKAEESSPSSPSKKDSVMTPVDTSTTAKDTTMTTATSKVENNEADDDSKPAAAAATTTTTTTTKDDTPSTPTTTRTTINNDENNTISQPFDIEKAQRRRSSLGSLSGDNIEYDFDSKNVPKGKVDSREFLDPCKAIATLQIARDLRNDTAVQLSSLMSTLPKDIEEACKNHSPDTELSKETIHDYSMRIPSKLLDLDINEHIQTIQTFQELIRRQMTAREKLIHLLLKSRCHFGSEPAAKYFGELHTMMDQLQRRKQLLGDALELEGLDNELDNTDFDKEIQALQPLSWYKGSATTTTGEEADDDGTNNNKNEGPPSNKKARLS